MSQGAEDVVGTVIGTAIGYTILLGVALGLVYLGHPCEGYADALALGFGGLILLKMVVNALRGVVG